MHHQEKKGHGSADVGHMEMKGQTDAHQQPSQQQYGQYSDQNPYAPQVYQPQQQQHQPQQQTQPYDPTYYEQRQQQQQQQTQPAVYAVAAQQPPQEVYGGGGAYQQQTSDQYAQQTMYNPHGATPVQQQAAYHPPQ
jgi:hypothetical protein